MQFLKGLTRWFHFGKTPTTIESSEPIQEVPAEPQQLVTRRNLLFGLGATAIVAAMPEIPLGRVWSFPRIIRTSFADPGRIDMLNLDAWDKVPWDAQSVALQLEKVRHQLPLLFERDDALFKLIGGQSVESVSARAMRVPIISDSEIRDYSIKGVPLYGSGMILTEEISRAEAKRRYPQFLSGSHPALLATTAFRFPTPRPRPAKCRGCFYLYGNALAEKVDRTVVKPVRDELESVCDLVNG